MRSVHSIRMCMWQSAECRDLYTTAVRIIYRSVCVCVCMCVCVCIRRTQLSIRMHIPLCVCVYVCVWSPYVPHAHHTVCPHKCEKKPSLYDTHTVSSNTVSFSHLCGRLHWETSAVIHIGLYIHLYIYIHIYIYIFIYIFTTYRGPIQSNTGIFRHVCGYPRRKAIAGTNIGLFSHNAGPM